MQYRDDHRTGTRISALGLGCMRLPGYLSGHIDLRAAERVLSTAIAEGVNYFDCAYTYRGVEAAVGKLVERNGWRDRVLLATKLPHGSCRASEDFDRIFTASLERLRTDHVDYYLVHNLSTLAQWEHVRALGIEAWAARQKAAGRIGSFGFSFHGSFADFEELLDAYDWDFCQIQYNYANETYQAGTRGLKLAAARGLPVFVMEPLLGGKLAGGLPPEAQGVLRAAAPGGKEDALWSSPAAWGLRWVWDHPEVTMVLSGMGAPEQVTANCAVAERALPRTMTEREHAAVARALAVLERTNKVPCTGCGYCMPCPQGVDIPGCFSAYNASFALGRMTGMQQYLTASGALTDHPRLITQCVRCGACAKRCPQGIAVPDRLAEARRRLQPRVVEPFFGLVRRLRG